MDNDLLYRLASGNSEVNVSWHHKKMSISCKITKEYPCNVSCYGCVNIGMRLIRCPYSIILWKPKAIHLDHEHPSCISPI